jgi:DNA-binding MarR family transcriptional regulator
LQAADYAALAEFRHQLRSFLAFSEAAAREAGLEPQQHQLLLAVRGFGDKAPTVREVAERLVLKHHSTVELIDRLEEHGLVYRRRATDDRRAVRVHLAAAGEKLLEGLSHAHREHLRAAAPELMAALSTVLKQIG